MTGTASAARAARSPASLAGPAALLAVAVVAISSSAVLVRWAEAPAVSLAFWRTAGGAVLLVPLARRAQGHRNRHRGGGATAWRRPGSPPGGAGRGPWRLVIVAGAALGLHFSTWLASLELTSVAASVTLVSTAPVFVAGYLAATGHRPSRVVVAAVALAVVGVVVITGGDAVTGRQDLAGDGLALVGAAAMAAYLVAGGRARASLPTAAYASRAYAVAALCVLPVALVSGRALAGFDAATWLAIAAMVAGPQLAGHTVLNHLLSRLGPVAVSLALLLEPAGAAVLTWLAFGEVPPWTVWVGAPLVVTGLALQVRAGGRRTGATLAGGDGSP